MQMKPPVFGMWGIGCLALVLGCGDPTSVADPTRPDETPAAQPPDGAGQPRLKRAVHSCGWYSGNVTRIDPNWFELGAGWRQAQVEGKGNSPDNSQAKRISTTGTTCGGDPQGEGEQLTHQISDLRVGDMVNVMTHIGPSGEEWARQLRILRRPQGRIPPQHNDPFAGTSNAFHLQEQAEQDWEEKGIPIPKKYLDPQGRAPWTNPPYPPVAPIPREAKP